MPDVPVISIIDDDESVRVATKRLVRSLGFVGYAFASAGEFLQSPRINDSSCIIADVQMPKITGVELQGLLRAQGNSTPIILVTAFPDERIRAQALEAGAIGFLSKPFDGATLMQCLVAALKERPGKD